MLNNLRIEIIKTWYGKRYAIVGDFKHYPTLRDSKGNIVTSKKGNKTVNETGVAYAKHVAELKVHNGTTPAIYPLDKEGLRLAKEALELIK